MTIPSAARRSPVYVGNGAAVAYPFGFKTLDPASVVVTVGDQNDLNPRTLSNGVEYTVTLNPDQSAAPGGSIHYSGLPVGHRLVVTSATSNEQPLSISNQGAFHARVLEDALDRIVIQVQQLDEKASRAATLPVTSEADPSTYLQNILDTLDDATNVAVGQVEGYAEAALGSKNAAAASEAAASNSAAGAFSYKEAAGVSAAGAAASATGAAISAGNASTDASSALASKNAATTGASSAAASASTATTKAGEAAASASTATTKAGEAAASASSAYASAVNSQAWADLSGSKSFRNKLINAGFVINQRGYAGTAPGTANTYTRDRWRLPAIGVGVPFGKDSQGYERATAPAGGYEQVVEGANLPPGVYTLSWVGTATATVNGAAVTNGGQVTLPDRANATVRFISGTVSRPQLERGPVATPFEDRPVGMELAMCQRYYETGRLSNALAAVYTSGYGYTSYAAFHVQKRANPTVSITGFGTTLLGTTAVDSVASVNPDGTAVLFSTTAPPGTSGVAGFTWSADAEL